MEKNIIEKDEIVRERSVSASPQHALRWWRMRTGSASVPASNGDFPMCRSRCPLSPSLGNMHSGPAAYSEGDLIRRNSRS